PDELRRLATNGDLLDIETSAMFDGAGLAGTAGIREVAQDGPRHFRVAVDNAGSALPLVVEAVTAAGVEVTSAREHRLSFDEVFAILVARHESEGTAEEGADGTRTGRDGEAAA
ncbi:MAG: hypothetical protein QOF49_2126, partial [Chloroflexota bacterium]|nr:hypothetical protein [Chloroflexota bacterium]